MKADLLVQPDIEITKMASCYGSIRCATTMQPLSYVKDTCPLKINVSNKLPPETKKMIKDLLHKGKHNARTLSKMWVSKIAVQVDQKESAWEFDEFSRTVYMTLTPDDAQPGAVCRAVNDLVADFGGKQGQHLGINPDEEIE